MIGAEPDAVAAARAEVARARFVVFFTGAGVSAESGVPTFRGQDGLWKSHRPEELATPAAFRRDPALVWAWYQWRRDRVSACAPNEGHRAIGRFAERYPDRALIVTQNVDALHEAAVPSPLDVLHLHGSLFGTRCSACGEPAAEPGAPVDPAALPRCRQCDGLLRPDVVWFGEALNEAVLDRAFREAGRADVCVVAGTSAVVHPAASIPRATKAAGGALVEINPEPTGLSDLCDHVLRGPSARLLPALLDGA